MPSINAAIADEFAGHQVDLLRFDAGVRRKVLGHLTKLERELEKKIHRFDVEGVARDAFKRRRAEKLIRNVRNTIDTAYRDSAKTLRSELLSLSKLEGRAVVNTANHAIGFDLLTAQLSPDQLKTIVSQPILGAPLKDWWATQSNRTQNAFAQQVRLGTTAGETNAQIVRRVRGQATGRFISVDIDGTARKVREFKGGVLDASKRNAETLVRTSVQQVSNSTMMETYKENSDVVKAVLAIATFDDRTTEICIARSGASWFIESGEPTPESPNQEPFPGHPPWHPNCRTVLGPVTKTWEELIEEATGEKKKVLENLPTSTRASMDGQVPGNLNMDGFLNRKGDAFARKKLGPGRFDLWKDGKITLPQLIDQSGRPLTINQLERLTPGPKPPKVPPPRISTAQARPPRIEGDPLASEDSLSMPVKGEKVTTDQLKTWLEHRLAQDPNQTTISLFQEFLDEGHKVGRHRFYVNASRVREMVTLPPTPPIGPPVVPPTSVEKQIDDLIDQLVKRPGRKAEIKLQRELRKLGAKGGVKGRIQVLKDRLAHVKIDPDLDDAFRATETKRLQDRIQSLEDAIGRKVPPPKPVKASDISKAAKATEEAAEKAGRPLSGKEIREQFEEVAKKVESEHNAALAAIDDELKQLKQKAAAARDRDPIYAREGVLYRKRSSVLRKRAKVRKDAFHSLLKVDDPITFSGTMARELGQETHKRIDQAQEFLASITSQKSGLRNVRINFARNRRGRAFHRVIRGGELGDAAQSLNSIDVKEQIGTIVHEMGHALEAQSKRIHKRAQDFLAARARLDPRGLRPLPEITKNTWYGPAEQAWEDAFIDPYMGKDYGRRMTELVSMGTEMLYSNPMRLMNGDPEMFDWLIDVLRGIG